MNALFVPSIGLDVGLLTRLALSIDFPIAQKMVLNNGPTEALERFRETHPDWIVKEPSCGNRGVAGSWNDAMDYFPNEPTILIANEDCYFLPGQLEQMCRCADANQDAPLIHLNNTNAYYCFVWTRKGRERFGSFDENLFPAYFEDYDMRYRHRLDGVTTYPYAIEGQEPVPHGKPRVGGRDYSAMIQGCGLLNRAYMMRKWGTFEAENPVFQTPYRDGRLSPREWIWYPEERVKRHALWDAFMSLPNPSIYD